MYKEGDLTHYNQQLLRCTLDRCWKECLSSAHYNERKVAVEEFNKYVCVCVCLYILYFIIFALYLFINIVFNLSFRRHRYKKKGLAVVPVKFGISFTTLFLNQAGALVHIYTDGSVLISHGGIEMGQGLHTKMTQVCVTIKYSNY